MLEARSRWHVMTPPRDVVQALQKELGLSALTAKVLAARQFTVEEARKFLDRNLAVSYDPFLMKGMKAGVDRIRRAVETGERIRVYGDYDCDGVTSTAIMMITLRKLGGLVDYYIPDRFHEGYGLNHEALLKAKDENIDLILTVDTGISGYEEVAYAKTLGLECIVTDHHQPPSELPQCVAVINPHQEGCSYPFKELSGAGIALKIAEALLGKQTPELQALAAIGTIADLVPLVDENRTIARLGLESINRIAYPGIEAIIEVSGLEGEQIDEQHVGFALAPRLNACGRMKSADLATELLLVEDRAEARALAEQIDMLNRERQRLVGRITEEALQILEKEKSRTQSPGMIVVAKEGWHEGVLGIVASKLMERFYLPTMVLSIDAESGLATGSARSIEGFDIYRALDQCREWLVHFGGHPMAAGLTIRQEHVPDLHEHLDRVAQEWLTEDQLRPQLSIDAVCSVGEVTVSALEELQSLAPFGKDNPAPLLQLPNVALAELRQVGSRGDHVKCAFRALDQDEMSQDTGGILEAIGFGWGSTINLISPQAIVDVVGTPSLNHWNGRTKAQLQITDLKIKERQFFDWRSKGNRWIETLPEGTVVCCFRDRPDIEKMHDLSEAEFEWLFIPPSGKPEDWSPAVKSVLLYDMPNTFRQLEQFCRHLEQVERIYMLFHHQESRFFSTLPTREHFKWYYSFLYQRKTFDLHGLGAKLAKRKGWTVDTLHFMTDVFLELQFVTIEQGQVKLVSQPAKRELSQSEHYRRRQETYQLEQALIYSPQVELSEYLSRLINSHAVGRLKDKEEAAYGF